MIGSIVGIYNGKSFNGVEIKVCFSCPALANVADSLALHILLSLHPQWNRGSLTLTGETMADVCVASLHFAARDDWHLPG
jgi:hypothetical protein